MDRTTLLIALADETAAAEMYKCMVRKVFRPLLLLRSFPSTGSQSFRNASVQGLPVRALAPRPHQLIQQPVHKEDMGFGRMAINPRTIAAAPLLTITQAWQRREITTYQYLMHLNTAAGRSHLTLSQYPVFPWVLSDYTSKRLDLKDPASYRDFRYPMGAQTEEQRRQCDARYEEGEACFESNPEDGLRPFHFGSHYSCSAFVLWYLVRLQPYTSLHKVGCYLFSFFLFYFVSSSFTFFCWLFFLLILFRCCRGVILTIPIGCSPRYKPPTNHAPKTAPTSRN